MAAPKSKEWLAGVEAMRQFMIYQSEQAMKTADYVLVRTAKALADASGNPESADFISKRAEYQSANGDAFRIRADFEGWRRWDALKQSFDGFIERSEEKTKKGGA